MSERAALSRTRRTTGVRFHLTERDLELLRAVNRYRYLRTGQIKRLVFPENRSLQSTRRRLKYLFHNGFLGRIAPLAEVGKAPPETAYYLDKAGIRLLEDLQEPVLVPRKVAQVRPMFLEHALDLSEFRIHLDRALHAHPMVGLKRFISDFEVKAHLRGEVGRHRYKLYRELIHPTQKQRYVVYPDALIILQGKGRYARFQRLLFLEIDRGTEGLQAIRNKIIGYVLYQRARVFQNYGPFDDFRVLLQAPSQKRVQSIRHALTHLEGAELLWVANVADINETTLLHAPIWVDADLQPRALLKEPA